MVYKNWIPVTIAAVFIATGCNNANETQDQPVDSPVEVTIAKASGGELNNAVNASGQVEAVQTANISTRVMGYITNIYVKVADVVKQGQLLFTVSSGDIQARQGQADAAVAQAEAAFANAEKDYNRFTILYKQQSASAKELDNAVLQYNTAKSSVDAAKQMRNEVLAQKQYTNVVAPFSGIVTQKMIDAGSIATPGMPVLSIQQGNNLRVSSEIPETEIASIKNGADAIITISSAGKTITGKITQVSPSSQFTGGQYIIKISLPSAAQQGLFAGMYVNVSLPIKQGKAPVDSSSPITVPLSCIIHKDELDGLYTIGANKQAVLRLVRLGKTYGERVEVLSGLDRNEPFITNAGGRLYNGAPVIVK